MMDDWDAVSDAVPKNSVTDPWDAVSAPQPKRRKPRKPIKISISRRFVLIVLAALVVVTLFSGATLFILRHPVLTVSSKSTPTAIAGGIGTPAGYWKLDAGTGNVAVDSSPNHKDGVINGASWSANHAPVQGFNYSLSFNGNGDLVSIPDSSGLDFFATDPMTISLWFDLSALPNVWHAIGKRSGCSLTSLNYQLAFDASHGLLFDSGGDIVATGITSLQTGEWMQFGATYSPISHILAVFLDGKEVIEKPNYMLSGENTAPLLIGESGTCGYTFPGNINEVCIWRQTLTDSQIADLARGIPCMK